MIDAGEDPKLCSTHLASEDIGNADPQALLIAHAASPRSWILTSAELTLRKAVIHMAWHLKSNAAESRYSLHGREQVQGEKLSYLRDRTPYSVWQLSPILTIILGDGLNSSIFRRT